MKIHFNFQDKCIQGVISHIQITHIKRILLDEFTPWLYLAAHEGGEDIAQFVAELAEKQYTQLSSDFLFELSPGDRITSVTYKSHNDFEQTNVSFGQQDESVGGFTEFFKTRVVVPFEGSY